MESQDPRANGSWAPRPIRNGNLGKGSDKTYTSLSGLRRTYCTWPIRAQIIDEHKDNLGMSAQSDIARFEDAVGKRKMPRLRRLGQKACPSTTLY